MLAIILQALNAIGPVLAAADEVQEVFKAAGLVLNSSDQDELRDLLDELRDDRVSGHARLQAKLAEAAKR